MPKERKPGWNYYYSEALKLEFAIHKDSGWVYFPDGVKYSPEEINVLSNEGGVIELSVHNVKKIFNGEIVKNEYGNTNGGNTHKAGGDIQDIKNDELEIY